MLEAESAIVVSMAKEFIQFLIDEVPDWREGYFRIQRDFHRPTVSFSVKASAVIGAKDQGEAELLQGDLDNVASYGEELFAAMRKERGVMLLVVNSDFEYNIHFDFSKLSRWQITKMDGGTGVPKDIPKD